MPSPSARGFALAEVLVAIFVLGVSTVAITGLSMLGSRSSLEAGRQTVAIGLVNQHIEQIRGLSYGNVGFIQPASGEPDGVLTHEQKMKQGQQTYTVTTTIKLVDDPANGAATGFLTESNADYKAVKIEAKWTAAGGTARDVSTTTYVANAAVTCTPGAPAVCQPPGGGMGGRECTPGSTCPGGALCLDSGLCGSAPAPSALPQCKDCSAGVCPSPTPPPSVTPSPSPFYNLLDCPASGLCPTTAGSPTPTPSPVCPPGALYCNQPSGSPTPTPNPTPAISCGLYCSCAVGQVCDTASNTCCDPTKDPNCTPPPPKCPTGQVWDEVTQSCKKNDCSVTGCPTCQTCNTTVGTCDAITGATCSCTPVACPYGQTWDTTTCSCKGTTCTTTGCPTCQTCNAISGMCVTDSACSPPPPCDPATNPACPPPPNCPSCQLYNATIGQCAADPSCNFCGTTGCPAGQICNPGSGQCDGCTDTSQCPTGQVCTNGSCNPNCNTSGVDCAGNRVCNPTTGSCDPPIDCSGGVACPSGLVCNGGICEGPECNPPPISVDCSLLEPVDPDPTCLSGCSAGGRFVINSWTPVGGGNTDPYCSASYTVYCAPNQTWAACPCPSPTPGVCGDGVCNYGQETLCGGAGTYYNCPMVPAGVRQCVEDCAVCGDGYCTNLGPINETANCPRDCYVPPSYTPSPSPPLSCRSIDPNFCPGWAGNPDACCASTESCYKPDPAARAGFCLLNCAEPGGTYCPGSQECRNPVCVTPTPTPSPTPSPVCGGSTFGVCVDSTKTCEGDPFNGYHCEKRCENGGQWCTGQLICVLQRCEDPCGSSTGGLYCPIAGQRCISGSCQVPTCQNGGSNYCSNGYICVGNQCTCGNGFCDGSETINNCPGDCTNSPSPTPSPGWCLNNGDCPYPLYYCPWSFYCTYSCGVAGCQPEVGEDSLNCPADCGACSINLDAATCATYNCVWNSTAPYPPPHTGPYCS